MATIINRVTPIPEIRFSGSTDLLIGLWLVISPFILNYSANGGSEVSDITVGLAILLLGSIRLIESDLRSNWAGWTSAILGIWLIISPFALAYPSNSPAMWNDVVAGIVLLFIAMVGLRPLALDNDDDEDTDVDQI